MRWKKLRFRDEYIPLILTGRKRSTIRLEKKKFKVGDTVYLASLSTGRIFGKAKITGITKKTVAELSDEDAKRDGFKDKISLIETLKSIYGNIPEDTSVYIIEFKVIMR